MADDWVLTLLLPGVLLTIDIVIRCIAVAVVPVNRRPSSAMAWLLAVFFIPYLGALLFLFIGDPKLPSGRRTKQREINRLILDATRGMDLVAEDHPWPPWLPGVVQLNRNLGAMPLVGGNRAEVVDDYETAIRAMADEVRRARHYVHAEFYILARDATTEPFFEALADAVRRGVVVRVLFDHIGSLRMPGYRRTIRHLTEIGVIWHPMLPVQLHRGRYQRPDLRNHRKLLVVDAEVAWVGSQNMVDRSYNHRGNRRRGLQWQDLMVRMEGPVVSGVDALFLTDWYSETDELLEQEIEPVTLPAGVATLECQVVPSGPGFEGENNLRLFNTLLYSAQERISIVSPYFVPDESMLFAITTAAQRGLSVELFVSEIGDQLLVHYAQRSYYETLLRAGVRIFRYPAPYVLHDKHMIIDDVVSVVGSSNMDIRSFILDLEVSVMVCGKDFAADLRRISGGYRERSTELFLKEWMQRSHRHRLLENLARLTSALQ
ncbi:cardiolipin synthase [Kineococcus xinjiangensis]|uniref:Cardiolipin synthase n=1 Tax=Kineococcus xinjiangensis TaxID=512762 RepID=A0A2S6IG46_9ACTN|nr:cardiolipin synthase [Kineococcus xinjiangensis]